jgi:hypothetical protein
MAVCTATDLPVAWSVRTARDSESIHALPLSSASSDASSMKWALAPLRVRGVERVKLHADLTILAKLACALSRARAVPLAA